VITNRSFHVNLTNQPEKWVEDQLLFLNYWAIENGFKFSYSSKFKKEALNFLFDGATLTQLELDSINTKQLSIFLIATEHLSHEGNLYYNGLHWSKQYDASIDKFTSQKRLGELVNVSELCDAIVILGDLPKIDAYKKSFPNKLIFYFY
jgi:hypothetical protein